MARPISWHVELRVRAGCMPAFLALNDEMVAATRDEPGALLYERYLAPDGESVHVLERYRDCAAAADHLRVFSTQFATRFAGMVTRIRFEVFGEPDAALRPLLDAVGATYAGYLAGFDRAPDGPGATPASIHQP